MIKKEARMLATENVKNLRVDLYACLQALPIDATADSRYNALAKTNLELGRMWLGEVLNGLGTPNPYLTSTNPADTTEDKLVFASDNTIDKLKEFREMMQNACDQLMSWYPAGNGFLTRTALQNAFTHLKTCKMALGMELYQQLKAKDPTPLPQ